MPVAQAGLFGPVGLDGLIGAREEGGDIVDALDLEGDLTGGGLGAAAAAAAKVAHRHVERGVAEEVRARGCR